MEDTKARIAESASSHTRRSKRKERSRRALVEKRQRLERRKAFSSADVEPENLKNVRVPRKKYCIAFGYVGTNYHGYQKQTASDGSNEELKTVEGTLYYALESIGAFNKRTISKLQLSKTSRTDKGVHAACTYIGGKFEFSDPLESHVGSLNQLLPQDIRCFQILAVTKGFDARSMCSKRKYEYLIPAYVLERRYKFLDEEAMHKFKHLAELMSTAHPKDKIVCNKLQRDSDKTLGEFEDSQVDLKRLQDIFDVYCGSRDFSNFTPRHASQGTSTQRYIHEIKVKEGKAGDAIKFVRVKITGQSFLYNQIRKMVALAVETYLETAPQSAISFALSNCHIVTTNIAPSQGLFLHHPYFDAYNRTRCNPPQTPFILYEDIKPLVKEFKRAKILPEIVSTFSGTAWDEWLNNIANYPFYIENGLMKQLE